MKKPITKLRVLIIIPASYSGGAEQLVLDQLKLGDKNKFEYTVVALREGNAEETFVKIPEYICMKSRKRYQPSTLRKLNRLVKQKKISIIHTHLIEADLYGYLLKIANPKLKWITTKHNNDEFRKKIQYRIFHRLISFHNSEVIAVSQSVKDFISRYEHIPKGRITIIPNGVNTERFSRNVSNSFRASQKIRKKDFLVGAIGRLTYQKGHEYLIEALALANSKIPRLKAIIVGEGEKKDELLRICCKLKISEKVIFIDYQENIEEVYKSLDVFCLPSRFEGMPLVLLEAMACERYCICSDITNNKEIISDDTIGRIIPLGDTKALAKALIEAYEKPDMRLTTGKKARKRVVEKYSINRYVAELEALYSKHNK